MLIELPNIIINSITHTDRSRSRQESFRLGDCSKSCGSTHLIAYCRMARQSLRLGPMALYVDRRLKHDWFRPLRLSGSSTSAEEVLDDYRPIYRRYRCR